MTGSRKNLGRVEIGGEVFELAEQVGSGASTFLPHYKHSAETLLAQRQNIDGKPGRQNIREEVMFMAQDSWAGGLGQKFYDPNKVKSYYRGSGNPRNDGFLSSTPTRTDSASPTGAYMAAPAYASGGGFVYMVNSNTVPVGHTPVIYQTSDLVTWNYAELSDGADGDPSWNRNIACDQNGNAYVVLGNPTTINRIIRVTTGLVSDLFHYEVRWPTGSNLGARGAAVWEDGLYVWTGIKLYKWDITSAKSGVPPPAIPPTEVGSAGRDSLSTMVASADCVNCGDGIAMFTSQPGMSRVWQYRRTVSNQSGSTDFNDIPAFSQLWTAPPDVILWSICAQDGKVYVAGNQDKGVTVWEINLATNAIAPVVRITPDQEDIDA